MSYVIIEKCLGERYASCVAVCPVDCIYPGEYNGEAFMVIDPTICITCGACLPECPIAAIGSLRTIVLNGLRSTRTFRRSGREIPRLKNAPRMIRQRSLIISSSSK